MMSSSRSGFLCNAITKQRFPLVVKPPWYTPFLINSPGTGHRIAGEVYQIEDKTLQELDIFEKVPAYYLRIPIELDEIEEGIKLSAFAYFKTEVTADLFELPMMSSYQDDRYVPRSKRNLPEYVHVNPTAPMMASASQ